MHTTTDRITCAFSPRLEAYRQAKEGAPKAPKSESCSQGWASWASWADLQLAITEGRVPPTLPALPRQPRKSPQPPEQPAANWQLSSMSTRFWTQNMM